MMTKDDKWSADIVEKHSNDYDCESAKLWVVDLHAHCTEPSHHDKDRLDSYMTVMVGGLA